MTFRQATAADVLLLARMNRQLIEDEGHRNPMSLPQLEERMADWLATDYHATIFGRDGELLGYALYRFKSEHVYLRQFFVAREHRREGVGRAAMEWLRRNPWHGQRVRLEVLCGNTRAIEFYKAIGFSEYCLTMEMEAGE